MKTKMLLVLLLAVLVIFACQKENSTEPTNGNIHPQQDIPWPSLADSPWPMHHHDPQSTGRFNQVGPQRGKIKWIYDAGFPVGNSPAIGKDSTIYFCSSLETVNNGQTSFLYALDFNGNLKWKFQIHDMSNPNTKVAGSPLIAADGTIYVGSPDHHLYAVNPDGTLKWKFTADDGIGILGMNIGLDGAIYFIDDSYNLYAVNPNGSLRWKVDGYHKFQTVGAAGISFAPDGNTLYVGVVGTTESDTATGLAAVDLNGKVKWFFRSGAAYGTPLVDNDGNIFYGAGSDQESDGAVLSVTSEGKLRWKYLGISSMPDLAMDYDGNVYFAVTSANTSIVSLDHDGKLRWKREIISNGALTSSLICDNHNTIYAASMDTGYLYAINPDGSLKWKLEIGPIAFVSPAMAKASIFIGTWDFLNKGKKFLCVE